VADYRKLLLQQQENTTKQKNMNTETNEIRNGLNDIADDTRALLAATADVAEEKVVEARNRLTAAMSYAKDSCAAVQKKAVASAKATDKAIRDNPYQAIGIAFGVGALVGFILSRRDNK
jgi:ElaB/YqjD/DUF883 family membrane-anchored ribosome-binding protein